MYSQLEGLGMTQQQASGWIAQQITNQGLIISANEIFWMSAGYSRPAGAGVVC